MTTYRFNEAEFYAKQVLLEEVIFRLWGFYLVAYFTNNLVAICVTTIVWSLAHLILFKWQMVIATLILGFILGYIMICFNPVIGLFLVFLIHYIVGVLGYKLKIINKWQKDDNL